MLQDGDVATVLCSIVTLSLGFAQTRDLPILQDLREKARLAVSSIRQCKEWVTRSTPSL